MIRRRNETMSSKERVLTAFARQEPDRVPINYFSNPGIDARLKAHFGLKRDDDEGLYEELGVDFRIIELPYTGKRLHEEIAGKHVSSEWGIRTRWIEHESGGYWDYCDFPLEYADEEQIAAWPMPSPDDYEYGIVLPQCEKHEKYAIYAGGAGLGDIINSTGFLRGMEQTLVDLATDDPAGLLLIDRKIEIQLETTVRTLDVAKGKVDFLWIGEDLGTQNSPLISLELFRRNIRPRMQKFIDLADSYNIPVIIHSCGSSSWAYEDFIDMGIKIVDTLQPEAKDMQPEYLKKRFGDRLAFHGCISTAGPVAYGSEQDVIDDVKKTLGIMMPGGGYCMSPTHELQDNSPTENVAAMYQAAHDYGSYRY